MNKLEEKTISCIIPTYNRCPDGDRAEFNPLFWAVTSLAKQPNVAEVIVVDDGSEDYTEKIVRYLEGETKTNIKYVQNQERQGSGRSRNEGAELAECDKVWFMDDDCIVIGDNVLKKLEYAFDFLEESEVEMPGAITLPVSGNSLESPVTPSYQIGRVDRDKGVMLGCYTKFPEEYLERLDDIQIGEGILRPLEIELMGGVFLASKSAFKEAGGFPSTVWRNACAEEPILMMNMHEKGYNTFYLPSMDPEFRVFHCRYGDPGFQRIPYDLEIGGLSFNDVLKRSSVKRSNTGNRVSREDEFYSNVLSDMYFMFRFFGDRVGMNNLATKSEVIAARKIFPEVERRDEIFRRALTDGIELLKKEGKLRSEYESDISSRYLSS